MRTYDLVVVLPGIMGSTLHRDGEPIWSPSAGAALNAIRSFGRSMTDLKLPDGVGDDAPGDGVEPVALMPDIHVLPGLWTVQLGYDKLVDWLGRKLELTRQTVGGPPGNLLAVPYDWRLSNRHNGRRLKMIVEPALERWRSQGPEYADARVVFVCHSMGGLVARWYIQHEGGAEVTRKLITLGTPHRGSLNALTQLVNGVRKGPWPFRLDLTEFARTIPSLYQLLPEYACIDVAGGLKKTTEISVPVLSTAMVEDAMRFHEELDGDGGPWWERGGFDLHPVHGQNQRTATTAQFRDGKVVPLATIGGADERGDGTVPSLSAIPNGLDATSAIIRHVTERHGVLQHNESIFDELEGVLTANRITHRAPAGTPIDVHVEDVLDAGEPIEVEVAFPKGGEQPVEAMVVDEHGRAVDRARLQRRDDGVHATSFEPPGAGAYELRVGGYGAAVALLTPVTAPLLVWDAEG